MLATHRVKDSRGDTIGFIIDNNFYADYIVKENINYIENLKLLKNGVSIDRIKIANVDNDYVKEIRRVFSMYKIPVNLNEKISISIHIIVKLQKSEAMMSLGQPEWESKEPQTSDN